MLPTILGTIGLTVLWLLWHAFLAEPVTSWVGKVTGFTRWADTARFRERVRASEGAYLATMLTWLITMLVFLFGLAMTLAPPANSGRRTGVVALGCAGALVIVAW